MDGSHPPTHLRIALAAHAGNGDATVTAAEGASIAAELAPHRARIATGLLAG
ncbi:hypothetical protein [Kitasatospora sp. NPDC059599]|uniref:hypothetical protein n=1 Tax=Kitasatospora sp. NPDC059599 TaxID=3346880 RepID=UPI003673F321